MIFTADGQPIRKSIGFVNQWFRYEDGGDVHAVSSERSYSEFESNEQLQQGETTMSEYAIKDVGGDKGGIPAKGDMAAAKKVADCNSKSEAEAATTKIGGDWADHETTKK